MSQNIFNTTNTSTTAYIKQEITDDDIVQCTVCEKSFASEMALNNHVRLEHMSMFETGDPSNWTKYLEKPEAPEPPEDTREVRLQIVESNPSPIVQKQPKVIKVKSLIRLDAIKVKMERNDSEDDSPGFEVISVLPDPPIEPEVRIIQSSQQYKVGSMNSKKVEEVVSGPFECLQPSKSAEDGVCHRVFFECCEYSIHNREEHFRRKKGFRCQICEKPLGVQADGTIAPFSCHVCGIGYDNSDDLSDHLNMSHTKERPFECNLCLKRFTQQGGLQQHMRMHTGDRPFACTYCPKAFTQKSGLEQHLRIHTKVKPYKCVICEKSFTQSVHLKQHMRTHTNVTPFQCGLCRKRFKQSSHLNYHLKSHHQIVDRKKFNKFSQFLEIIEGQEVIEVPIDNIVELSDGQRKQNDIDQEEQDRATSSITIEDEEETILST